MLKMTMIVLCYSTSLHIQQMYQMHIQLSELVSTQDRYIYYVSMCSFVRLLSCIYGSQENKQKSCECIIFREGAIVTTMSSHILDDAMVRVNSQEWVLNDVSAPLYHNRSGLSEDGKLSWTDFLEHICRGSVPKS